MFLFSLSSFGRYYRLPAYRSIDTPIAEKRLHLNVKLMSNQVLLQEGGANNILSELTRAQFRDARRTIVQAILGTDMSSHMQHCAEVFQFAQKAKRLRAGEAAAVATSRTATRSSMGEGKHREGRVLTPSAARKRFWGVVAGAMARGAELRGVQQDGADTPAHKRSKSGSKTFGTPGGATAGDDDGECNGSSTVLSTPQQRPPRPQDHIFSVDRAEDRSFLTQTIVHWCVRLFVFLFLLSTAAPPPRLFLPSKFVRCNRTNRW